MSLSIAQVAPLWTPVPPASYGGIELVIDALARRALEAGHHVTLFATGDSTAPASEIVSVCDVSVLEKMNAGSAYSYEHYAAAHLASVLRRAHEFDAIHLHVEPWWMPIFGAPSARVVHTLHSLLTVDDRWSLGHRGGASPVAISRSQLRESGMGTSEIPVIHNGCSFDSYAPSFESGRYLAFIGRMSSRKGVLEAIAIARRVDIPLIIAGQPGTSEEYEYFKDLVEPRVDEKNVVYIGAVNHTEKTALLRGAIALLFPSLWPEPFGMVMIEAMACGTPVVALARGSVPEIVEHGTLGYISDDIRGMDSLIAGAARLDRRIVRRVAESRFSDVVMTAAYLELFQQLAAAPPSSGS